MTVGVLGGGQLGRMLALAGYPLGMRFRFLDFDAEAPARDVAPLVHAPFDDRAALDRFAAGLDVVTYEFENVPVDSVRHLATRVPVVPPARALEAAQDRLSEKTLFQRLGVATPRFAAVETREDLDRAVENLGLPVVLKTRRFGYDGKGQAVLRTSDDLNSAWGALGGRPLIVEAFVPFDRELSIIIVRGRSGEEACYPLVQNEHRDGILRLSIAPAPDLTPALQSLAQDMVGRIARELDYVGVLALELFQVGDELLANEMAPRVHNSGHWTIEGAQCSQFENHLRAIAGLPLGSAAPVGHSAMLNLIGETGDTAGALRVPGAHLHLYGKSPRPGRKLGHITVCASTPDEVLAMLDQLREAANVPKR